MTSVSKASVTVLSQHTVRSAHEESWTTLVSPFRLGPLDQLVSPIIPVAIVFVYEQRTNNVELIPIERLERALTLLLDYYPHLTGRLNMDASDGRHEITRLGTGAELFVARCNERLTAESRVVSMSNLPDAGNALFAPYEGLSGPMFTVQHTRFACGGVALGVRLPHTVCDADGFFQLVRDLAALYRDLKSDANPSPAHRPHILPYMAKLQMTPEERSAALAFRPSLLHIEPTRSADDETFTSAVPPTHPVVGRFMRFSGSELDVLKARATEPSSNNWISTFEALAAHLYQRIYKARLQLHENQPEVELLSDFLIPVNIRSRLGRDYLPPPYFPNALLCTYTALPQDVLARGPLWQIAKAIHELTRTSSTTSREEINRTLEWIAVQPDKGKIRPGFRYGNGSFMVSQWNKFDMYGDSVFDDPPVLVSTPFTSISLVDGLVYFLPTVPSEAGTGAIDVCLALSEPLWDILDRDEGFCRGSESVHEGE